MSVLNLLLGTMESGGCEASFGTFDTAIIFKTDEAARSDLLLSRVQGLL
jgi:hypothetical protein